MDKSSHPTLSSLWLRLIKCVKVEMRGGNERWRQEVEMRGGYKRWRQEVEMRGGDKRWR